MQKTNVKNKIYKGDFKFMCDKSYSYFKKVQSLLFKVHVIVDQTCHLDAGLFDNRPGKESNLSHFLNVCYSINQI